MKKIKKLKLINWHFFEDQEINFSDINVITGENGTGKSTILDAIHFLQSGGTCKFNTAAKTQSQGRNVINYVKARIGLENKEFLRDQNDIISHIAIEYFDTLYNHKYVLGCVIQLDGSQQPKIDFYEIKDGTWNNTLFFTPNNKVRNFDNLLKEGETQGLQINRVTQPSSTNARRARDIANALGIPEKYDVLFSKALSFEPLDDINKFAIDFLLPEEIIDLSTIKGSMDEYQRLKGILSNEKKRQSLLEPIYKAKDKYRDILNKIDAYDLLLISSQIQIEEETIKSSNNEIAKCTLSIENNNQIKEQFEKQIQDYDFEIKQLESNPKYNALKDEKEKLKECDKQLKEVQNRIKAWLKNIEEESTRATKLGTSLDLSNIVNQKRYEDYLNVLQKYNERINDIEKNNDKVYDDERMKLHNVETELINKEREINELKEGSYSYPDYVNKMKDIICQSILNKKGISEPKITPFCSLLEIVDEDWRYAIEGYLDRSRFDFFIKKDFVEIAKECFKNNVELKNYFGVGVVTSFDENKELNNSSLASKVRAVKFDKATQQNQELIEPTKYIKFLLNDIICVEDIKDFVKGQRAITKNGVYFDGRTIRYVNKIAADKSYIGLESIKMRLIKAEEGRNKLYKEEKDADKAISNCKKIRELLKCSLINELVKHENSWWIETTISNKINEINAKIKDITENSDLLTLSVALENLKSKEIDTKSKLTDLEKKNDELNKKIGQLNEKRSNSKLKIEEKNKDYKNKFDEYYKKNNNLKTMLNEISQNLTGTKLYSLAFQSKGNLTQRQKNIEEEITNAMFNYSNAFPKELKAEINNYQSFIQRYNKIVNDQLPKFEPEVDSAKEKATQELREHFISKIRNAIKKAKKDISDLNYILERHPFGTDNEVFNFSAKRSKDDLLSSIYRIAMDTNQDSVTNNLLTEDLDKNGEEALSKVFEILSAIDEDTNSKAMQSNILDYRNYLNYDIEIKLNKGLDTLSYTKNQNAKSGGETQTPFYALIAAAFQSVINIPEKNKNSPGSLVAFDEAFNNMDGERIRQMLEFYKDLNIQLIISVPSSRFPYISQYADNIISLAKEDNTVAVFETKIKEEK